MLITRPTIRSQVLHLPAKKPLAKARIDLVSAKSSFRTSTCWFPVMFWISLATNSPLCTSRQAIYTRAPVKQCIRDKLSALFLSGHYRPNIVIFHCFIYFTPISQQRDLMNKSGKKSIIFIKCPLYVEHCARFR